jgi:hypothetical protein
MKRKKLAIILAVALAIVSIAAGFVWFEIEGNKLYTYDLAVAQKNYRVRVSTNWNSAPKLYLSNSSLTDLKYFAIDFIGSCRKTVTFKVTFPTDLLWGNLSLFWKYYQQNPDRFEISGNGDQTSIQMTFNHIATNEHFEIHGTEAVW